MYTRKRMWGKNNPNELSYIVQFLLFRRCSLPLVLNVLSVATQVTLARGLTLLKKIIFDLQCKIQGLSLEGFSSDKISFLACQK